MRDKASTRKIWRSTIVSKRKGTPRKMLLRSKSNRRLSSRSKRSSSGDWSMPSLRVIRSRLSTRRGSSKSSRRLSRLSTKRKR